MKIFAVSVFLACFLVSNVAAETVFQSTFTAADGTSVVSLPEWSDVASAGSTKTVDNNQAKFAISGTGWIYSSVRANATFDFVDVPGVLRFEYTITKMTDTTRSTTDNATSRLWLTNSSGWNDSGWNMLGEKMCWDMTWHRNASSPTADFKFSIVNRYATDPSPDTGVAVFSTTTIGMAMDGGCQVKLALEIRNDVNRNDVRVGYQIYNSGSWGAWGYSGWFDPTDANGSLGLNANPSNLSAFSSTWKSNWRKSTYFYTEQYRPSNRNSTVWIDDVSVTGDANSVLSVPAIYLNLSDASSLINTALADFTRCFKAISGSDLGSTPKPGFKPLRKSYIGASTNAGSSDPLKPQDYIVEVNDTSIVIKATTDLGISNGLYDILDRWGCRWIMPYNSGEVLPDRGTVLNLPVGVTRKHIMDTSPNPAATDGPQGTWYFRNRVARWGGWWTAQHYWLYAVPPATYFATHPEYYALIAGQRRATQLCTSNPAVVSLMINAAKAWFAANPDSPCFPMDPADNLDFCQCANCKALDPPGYMSDGQQSRTNRVVILANAVADAIKNDYPGKQVGFYAYSSHYDLPVGVNLHPNISVGLTRFGPCLLHLKPNPECASCQDWWNLLGQWQGICSNVNVYEYLPIYWTGMLPCPLYLEHGYAIKEQYKRGVNGLLFDRLWCYATNLPVYYMGLRMMTDANLVPEQVLTDMCYKFFGPAGQAMNDYYLTLAQVSQYMHINEAPMGGSAWGYERMFTPQMMTTARTLLNQAIALTQNDSTLSTRVQLVNQGQIYLEDYLAGMWSAQNGLYDECIAAFGRVNQDIDAIYTIGAISGSDANDAKRRMNTAKMKSLAEYFPDRLGFIRTWQILGPLNNDTCDATYYSPMFPSNIFSGNVTVCQPATLVGGKVIGWRGYTSPEGLVDFSDALPDPKPEWYFSSAHAAVTVTVPSARQVQFRMDSFFPFIVYVNGVSVYSRLWPNADSPDNCIATVNLPAGNSTVIFKSSQTCPPSYAFKWGFYFRITDLNGNLIPNLQTSICQNPVASKCSQVWSYGYGLRSDINKDCRVNFADFALMAADWLKCLSADWLKCNDPAGCN